LIATIKVTEAPLLAGPSDIERPSEQAGVLVVEENDGVRALLGMGLKEFGLELWLAGSGREALELLRAHEGAVAVVLLDVGMVEWDGPQTLAALRALRPDLLCCFMTGGCSAYSEADLLEMGASRVFAKPFSLDELARTLQILAARGERRGAPRLLDKQFKVVVASGNPGTPPQHGWLWNRSDGGIGLRLPAPVEVGSVLSVRPAVAPEDASWQQLKVKHCRQLDDGWCIGGQFLR
jgi:CheY-like chemotaxis protein